MPTSYVRDELAVVGGVCRGEAVEHLVHEHHDFEVDSLPHRQPVKLSQHRRDVLSSTSSSDQPSCRVLYRLQALDQTVGNAAQKSMAGWGIGGSVKLLLQVLSMFVRAMGGP